MTLTESINRVLEHCNREGHLLYRDNDTGIEHVYIGPSKDDRVKAVSLSSVFMLCVAQAFADYLDPIDALNNAVPDSPLPDFRPLYRSLHNKVNAVAWLDTVDRTIILKTRRTEGDDSVTTQMPLYIYLMGGLNKFDFPSYIQWFQEPKVTTIRNLEDEAAAYIQVLRDGLTSVTRLELIDINEQRSASALDSGVA